MTINQTNERVDWEDEGLAVHDGTQYELFDQSRTLLHKVRVVLSS